MADIIGAIEEMAPEWSQESWDNSGLVIGQRHHTCTGVMICVDVTPEVIAEAHAAGCNMIVSHHPVIFRGLKRITGDTVAQQAVIAAIRMDMNVYCCHTPVDRAFGRGVSFEMARMLDLDNLQVLEHPGADAEPGLGVIGTSKDSISPYSLIMRIKQEFSSPVVRTNRPVTADEPGKPECKIALCGGAGGEFIPTAIAAGADIYITSDVRYHDFLDYRDALLIIDIGHFEAENCTKKIFYELISEKFPNFAVRISNSERNTINYV